MDPTNYPEESQKTRDMHHKTQPIKAREYEMMNQEMMKTTASFSRDKLVNKITNKQKMPTDISTEMDPNTQFLMGLTHTTNMQHEDQRRIMTAPYIAHGGRVPSRDRFRPDLKTPTDMGIEHPMNSNTLEASGKQQLQ